MAGLDPAIHEFFVRQKRRTWMPGTPPDSIRGPGMTETGKGATPCETNFRDTTLGPRQAHGAIPIRRGSLYHSARGATHRFRHAEAQWREAVVTHGQTRMGRVLHRHTATLPRPLVVVDQIDIRDVAAEFPG